MGARIDLARLSGNTDNPERPADEPVTTRRPHSLARLLRRRWQPAGRTAAS